MDEQKKYIPKEIFVLFFLFIASLGSLFFYFKFRLAAFPEHNIRLAISRQEAQNKAEQLVKELNFSVDGYKRATIFEINEASKVYLEREIGASQTARLAENEVDLWHFSTRFFKPLEKEEFIVSFLPNGRLSGFRREIEEDKPGEYLSREEAQNLATKFLSERADINFAEWTLVGAETQDRPNRVDHTFVWEKDSFKAKEATLRVEAKVQGGQVGSYDEFLKIPEAWEREYEKERSRNDIAQNAANVAYFLFFMLPILVFFIIRFKHSDLRLRFSWWVAGIAAVISLLTALNSLPLDIFGFPTTESWGSSVAMTVLLAFLISAVTGVSTFFPVAAGEAIYRMVYPQGLALENMFNKAFFTKHVHQGLLVGTFASVISIAFALLYYFGGKKFGFWTPADINYSDAFSTALPWLYPLFLGFLAATTEEATFRLFGIPFLAKYLKSTWLAVIITSVVWAFLHSAYPQSPWFARGVELIPVGVAFGFLFLRYGILAAWVSHFTFNALITAFFLYSSQSLYVAISSTLVALLPLLAAFVIWTRYKRYGFLTITDELTNKNLSSQLLSRSSAPIAPEGEQRRAAFAPPLPAARALLLLVAAAASLITLKFVQPKVNLESQPVAVGREEAYQIAAQALEERGVDAQSFRHTVQFSPSMAPPYAEPPAGAPPWLRVVLAGEEDEEAKLYILDKGNFAQLKEIFPPWIPTAVWSVRFFRPLDKEEYRVDVLPQGTLYGITHLVEEDAPGANLSVEEATAAAQRYLAEAHGLDIGRHEVIEKSSEKRKFRTDHTIVFERKDFQVGDAVLRTRVKVLGDEPSWFYQSVKVPEEWWRAKQERKLWQTAAWGVLAVSIITFIVMGFVLFLRLVRQREIEWRRAFLIAGVAAILGIPAALNTLPQFYTFYQTSMPMQTHIVQEALQMVMGLVFRFFITAVIVGMLLALWRKNIGPLLPADAPGRRHHLRNALLLGYTAPVISAGVAALLTYLFIHKDWWLFTIPEEPSLGLGVDTIVPAIAAIGSLAGSLTAAAAMGVAAMILYHYVKRWYVVLSVPLILALFFAIANSHGLAKISLDFLTLLIALLGAGLLTVLIVRKNFWGYVVAVYIGILAKQGWQLFSQTHVSLQVNGLVLLFLLPLPILVYLWWSKKDQRTTTP